MEVILIICQKSFHLESFCQKILKLEDFADLASDELTGGFDVIKGERVKIHGYLEDFALSKEEADTLIMSARNIVYKD